MAEQLPPSSDTPEDDRPARPLVRLLGIGLILISVLAAVYLIVAYFAWENGQELRTEQINTQRANQISRQIELAQDDLTQGSYNLALDRLDWVLERDPSNEAALAVQRQVEAAQRTALTPQAQPTATLPPEPTPTPGAIADPETELARLQRLESRQDWAELASGTIQFQRQFPEFERLTTDALLYNAYLNQGLVAVQGSGDEIEQGLFYFSQAEQLGDLPQEALDYRLWAEIYLEAIAYYGVNWGVTSSALRELCLSAPFYQNACDKFYESLVNYADQFAFAQDWCPAVDLYREARQYGNGVNDKLSAAVEGCNLATPTPGVITGTTGLTGTTSITNTGSLEITPVSAE